MNDDGNPWYEVKDGDPRAVALFRRHYSCRDPHVDYCRYGFSGKGESMVLITQACDALWCWRKVEGEGVKCSVFRREGGIRASDMIRAACDLAYQRWGKVRLFTEVNAAKVRTGESNPGKCFLKAGWKPCGYTKKHKLLILELVLSPMRLE